VSRRPVKASRDAAELGEEVVAPLHGVADLAQAGSAFASAENPTAEQLLDWLPDRCLLNRA